MNDRRRENLSKGRSGITDETECPVCCSNLESALSIGEFKVADEAFTTMKPYTRETPINDGSGDVQVVTNVCPFCGKINVINFSYRLESNLGEQEDV